MRPEDQDEKDLAQQRGSAKPFASGAEGYPGWSMCWDCGFTWQRGISGDHSCVAELQRRLMAGAAR